MSVAALQVTMQVAAIPTVPQLNITQYLGIWYQVQKLHVNCEEENHQYYDESKHMKIIQKKQNKIVVRPSSDTCYYIQAGKARSRHSKEV